MVIELGLKSDPVEYRYSYPWLFGLMKRCGVTHLQLGSFFEMYQVPDRFFLELREEAESFGVSISSLFTAHRELGGFFSGNPFLEQVALKNYRRLIEVASLLGASWAGSNPGAVYRDRMEEKQQGLDRYIRSMTGLMSYARDCGLKGLTVEPMSCMAEPPVTPDEIERMMTALQAWHLEHAASTVPVYLCGDISHGYADIDGKVVHSHVDLFSAAIPWMCEFHIKNTDSIYSSTFGFSPQERKKGIVDLDNLSAIIRKNGKRWPVKKVIGYLEINGPKLGRDYSDYLLEEQLSSSIEFLHSVFSPEMAAT